MAESWRRRTFLGASAGGLVAAAAGARRAAWAVEIRRETFTYKTAGDCPIKADVFRPSSRERLPVAVWIHGGALIMGDRRGMDPALREELIQAGYAVVSIDYRLAPETKLPAILEDVRDAFAWIRAEGPKAFGARAERIAVLGGSAGGYLTLCTGFLVEPRPAALVSFWGYGDIAGTWYSRPDAFYRRQALVAESEARAAVGTTAIAEPPPRNQRFRFYLYCRQNGLWPREVAGHDPDAEPKAFDPFCPVRNVTPQYPPTLLIHGTADTDVPCEQSILMDRELTRHGVRHELISVTGGGHGLGNVDRARVAEIHRRAVAFIRQSTA
ncbi:MAG TPA: alpha/beta hydrolase [Isosphaeraceae bacterium]|nr:alpha/beta hydrolase [Isosphaeraceae bacterium]